MSKGLYLFLLPFFFFSNLYPFGYFRADLLPVGMASWSLLEYEKFETKIEIQGLFYETTIHVKAKLGSDRGYNNSSHNYYCRQPSQGDYEFTWVFSLPVDSYITGFEFWDRTKNAFVPVDVQDLTSAETNYAANKGKKMQVLLRMYRNRTGNTSVDQFYQLQISPAAWNVDKEFIIHILSPCYSYWDARRIMVFSRALYINPAYDRYGQCSVSAPAEFTLIDYDNPCYFQHYLFKFLTDSP